MNEKLLILERDIQRDLGVIDQLYEALGEPALESDEAVIVAAYRLHSLYTAFENIFRNIARAFENRLDPAEWHAQVLQRMRLDLTPVRPAVLDDEAYEKLDELRRFRHVFRTGYGLKLDALRLQLVVRKALQLKTIYRGQIERFLEFLRTL